MAPDPLGHGLGEELLFSDKMTQGGTDYPVIQLTVNICRTIRDLRPAQYPTHVYRLEMNEASGV